MKGKYFYLCAALFALNSCTNEINEDGFVDKSNAISFNSYTSKTRTAVGADVTTDNMKGDNFGVAGYTANNIYLYKKDNTDNKGVEQKWVSNGESGTWEYANLGDLKFWPNGNMDFYAYFPYTDNATFENTNSTGNVMTISNVDCTHDVLFAYQGNQTKTDRVPLTFHHAFSKIKKLQIEMPADGNLFNSNCQVEVETVEFINTSTKGNIKVDNSGTASYTIADPNVTFRKDLTSQPVTINSTVNANQEPTNNSKYLINNGENAKGYLFATNSTKTNFVTGTSKTLWGGDKTSVTNAGGKLSESALVCLKLTCKVWNGADDNKYYYVGNDNTYGEIYIPIKAKLDSDITPESADNTALLAGKRYTYIIKMKDNVGFTNAGDPILTPILFEVSNVDTWGDVTVTITL